MTVCPTQNVNCPEPTMKKLKLVPCQMGTVLMSLAEAKQVEEAVVGLAELATETTVEVMERVTVPTMLIFLFLCIPIE